MASAELLPNAADSPAPGFWSRADEFIIRTGERLNPILVKEARQAMKSRLFIITFALVLLTGWGWSILGLARFGPNAAFQAAGPTLFFGYYVILIAACTVIVPYGAFRSLSGEREDRTFELLSITTLTPRQIIAGKLGSAGLQLLVMFSALAPCLAFTYLLRGIDIVTIMLLLAYVGFVGLGLSMIALLMATLAEERNWQILLSVLLLIGLVICFIGMWNMGDSALRSWHRFSSGGDWIGHAILFTFYATTFALLYFSAAARLTFAGDNRATRLRIVMLVQFLCWVGWFTALIYAEGIEAEVPLVFMAFAAGYWYLMGAFMTGESPDLSPRVKRSLPETAFGKALLSWFFPGPGRGYVFVIGNVLGAAVLTFGMLLWNEVAQPRRGRPFRGSIDHIGAMTILLACYVVIYLGIGNLLLKWLRKKGWTTGLLLTLMVHLTLFGLGTLGPVAIDALILDAREYSIMEITNPIATFSAVIDHHTDLTPALLLLLPLAAVALFGLNFSGLVAELRLSRTAEPVRVAEDEAALHVPRQPAKTNPWDGEEGGK